MKMKLELNYLVAVHIFTNYELERRLSKELDQEALWYFYER
jgi:hypothetical protein